MVFTSRRMIIDKLAPIDGHVNCARKHIRRGSHRSMNYNQFCNVHHQYDSAKSAVSRTDVPFSPRGTAYSRKIFRACIACTKISQSLMHRTCCLPFRMSNVVSGTRIWATLAHRLVRQVAVKVITRTITSSRIVDIRAIITTAE